MEQPGAVQVDVGLEQRHRATLGDLRGFIQIASQSIAITAQKPQSDAGEQAASEPLPSLPRSFHAACSSPGAHYNNSMVPTATSSQSWGRLRNQRGLITRSVIRRLAQRIAERFEPERVILFGSYASGRPKPDSDVDLLVVMPARNEIDQSLRIEESLDPPFALDVIVRTPKNLAWRLKEGDWFLREVVEQGKVLYEKPDQGVGAKSRSGLGRRREDSRRKTAIER